MRHRLARRAVAGVGHLDPRHRQPSVAGRLDDLAGAARAARLAAVPQRDQLVAALDQREALGAVASGRGTAGADRLDGGGVLEQAPEVGGALEVARRSSSTAVAAAPRAPTPAPARAARPPRRHPPRSPTRAPTGRPAQLDRGQCIVDSVARSGCGASSLCPVTPMRVATIRTRTHPPVTRLAGAESGTLLPPRARSAPAPPAHLDGRPLREPVAAQLPGRGPPLAYGYDIVPVNPTVAAVLGRDCGAVAVRRRGAARHRRRSGGWRRSRPSSRRRSPSAARRCGCSSAWFARGEEMAAPPACRSCRTAASRWSTAAGSAGSTGSACRRRDLVAARGDAACRLTASSASTRVRSTPASASDATTGARAMPIYQTASYVFEDTQHAADLFDLNRFGNTYTRIVNPTTAAFEERVASLEGGVGALATASRPGARSDRGAALCGPGDEIVSAQHALRRHPQPAPIQFPRFGITTALRRPATTSMPSGAAITRAHQLLYAETIGNPRIDVLDIAGWAQIAADARAAADHRQHLRDAVPVPAVRARRAHRGALGHEVHRRARHLDRRRDRRLGRLRLGRGRVPRRHRAVARATAACASTRRSATSRSS